MFSLFVFLNIISHSHTIFFFWRNLVLDILCYLHRPMILRQYLRRKRRKKNIFSQNTILKNVYWCWSLLIRDKMVHSQNKMTNEKKTQFKKPIKMWNKISQSLDELDSWQWKKNVEKKIKKNFFLLHAIKKVFKKSLKNK